jgi:chemotaxis protein CheD
MHESEFHKKPQLVPHDSSARTDLGLLKNTELLDLKKTPRKPEEASFFFYDQYFKANAVKVLPGEFFVSKQDLVIMTVLGSCIAVCIWDPHARVGGMNHFMLPDGAASGKYGGFAMEQLIQEIVNMGGKKINLQAKVFGGGQVMASITKMNVGERNTDFALNYLLEERIQVVSQDVLDIHPRKVCFFPTTGKALVKKLNGQNTDII